MKKQQKSSSHCRRRKSQRGFALLASAAAALIGSLTAVPQIASAQQSRKPRVLIVGDSVFSMLLVADNALAELNDMIPVIYRGQPCQKLLTRGCIPETELSALQQFRLARGEFTDAVLVATGYNENRTDALRVSLREFRREAKRQHVKLIWATYRIAGNVIEKSTNFNRQLRAAAKHDHDLSIFDWNKVSGNRPSWFSGDKVHLSHGGTTNLARQLGKFLKRTLGPG